MKTAALSLLTATFLLSTLSAGAGKPRRADSFAPIASPAAREARLDTSRQPEIRALPSNRNTVPAGGLPNLVPFRPDGWSAPVVASTVTGTNSDSVPLSPSSEIFVDWAVINEGPGTATPPFDVDLFLDGVLIGQFEIGFVLETGFFAVLEDLNIGTLSPGSHTLQLVVDSNNNVAESNENDNAFSRQIQVSGTGRPNLTPFQPDGWSAPLVVSDQAGTNTDSSPLSPGEPLFIDWAVLNNGAAPTLSTYFVSLLVDGVEVGSWFVDPPHNPNEFVFVEDFQISPLAPGPHTFRLVADVRSGIDETDNSDNVFERQITVQEPDTQGADALPLIFPNIQGGSGVDTGVAIANPTDQSAGVELLLLDANDNQIGSATLQIGANQQVARTLTDLFGDAGRNVDGWMLAVSDNLGLVGFFLTFSDGARNIDGAEAASRGSDTVVFPEILTGGDNFTEITLVGAGPVAVELRGASGAVIETQNIALPIDTGRRKFRVTELFDAPIPSPAYVLARGGSFQILGYETFGSPNFLAGRNAIGVSEAARSIPKSLFGAQVAEVTGLESVITLINPSDGPANLDLFAFATGSSQTPVATRSVTLGSGQMIRQRARTLLELPNGDFVGWMRVNSDNASVVGDVSFGDNANYLASVQLQETPTTDFVFSHVADGFGFFTGVTLLNPTNEEVNVEVEVFNAAGVRTGAASLRDTPEGPLQPFEHRPRVLSQIIPGLTAQVGGYIRVRSQAGIFSFELFSLLSGSQLQSLAAVPPQRGNGILSGRITTGGTAAGLARTPYPKSLAKGVDMQPTGDFVPGEMVVQLRPGAAAGAIERIGRAMGLKSDARGADGLHLLRASGMDVPSLRLLQDSAASRWAPLKLRTLATIESLNADPDVLYAEPNFVYQPYRVPNDQFYNLQWHYPAMNLPAAWDVTLGSSDIIVAVIDSGVKFGHPELSPRLTGGGFDFIRDPQTALDGDGPDPDPEDPGDDPRGISSSYHGTHVAGTIGARTNDGQGVAGVNWVSPLMTLRALGSGGGTNFDISQAILYAAGLDNATGQRPARRANVVNMSLGGPNFSLTMEQAVQSALARNVVIVAAAGNENSSDVGFPAGYPGVITVGAIDLSGGKAPYSNFGPRIDVVAPGGNTGEDRNGDGFIDGVLSTLWNESTDQPLFEFYQGTSMAAPHVAGLASLMLSVNPSLSPGQIRRFLQDTALDLGPPGRDDTFGDGLVDALAALRAAGAQTPEDPALVVASTTLDFGATLTQLEAPFTNGGGGTLTVDPPVVETDPPAAGWLSAGLSGNSLNAQVTRQGLAEGNYTGRIRLTSNGGSATVEVRMSVGGGGTADVGTVFVLVLNPATFETVFGLAADASNDYRFRSAALPTGEYLIAAGTDLDEDGFICDEGEFCGFYPVTNQPETVTVQSNQVRSGVDFTVERSGLSQSAASPGRPAGFRIGKWSPPSRE